MSNKCQNFSLLSLYNLINSDENLFQFLIDKKLIKDLRKDTCEIYSELNFTIGLDRKAQLSRYFKCTECKNYISILNSSFFSGSRLQLKNLILLLYLWASNIPVVKAAKLAEISKPTAIQWYSMLERYVQLPYFLKT